MMPIEPLVSVVLLSFNRPHYLKAALDSVVRQSYQNLDILVIDNFSPLSGEIAEIVHQYANVRFIRNSRNLGYAGGMNQGIVEASGHYIYLTEDDITLDPDCLRHLVDYATQHSATGFLAPIMYNENDGTICFAGGEVRLEGVFKKKIFGSGEKDTGQFPEPFNVPFICGSAIFSRLDLLRQLGGFREDFFLYSEDVDLCARALRRGEEIVVVPQAKISHFWPEGGDDSPEVEFHKLKNFYSTYLLHAHSYVLPEFFCRYFLLGLIRAFLNKQPRCASFLRAWWWVFKNSPYLIKDRYSDSTPLPQADQCSSAYRDESRAPRIVEP